MPFVETDPFELSLFFKFVQNNKITNIDFCPNLVSASCSSQQQDCFFFFYVQRAGYIGILQFSQGCILKKTHIEVSYSYSYKITAISSITINSKSKQQGYKLPKGVYIFLGFEDGHISMYQLKQQKSYSLFQFFRFKPNASKKEPIINIKATKLDLIVVSSYSISLLKNLFSKEITIGQKYRFSCENIECDISSCKLDFDLHHFTNQIYLFNEFDGCVCLDLHTRKQVKRLQDSIKILINCPNYYRQITHDVLAIGCTDDSVKFIDYHTMSVLKFKGFKNYPSSFAFDEINKMICTSSLDGSIAFFSYLPQKIPHINEKFILKEQMLKKQIKVSQQGIKKILIQKNVLILLDCNHNIEFYDIIRKQQTTQRQTSSLMLQDTVGLENEEEVEQ